MRFHRPQNIPAVPHRFYKDKGWTSWFDFLGTNKGNWLPYEEARDFVRNIGLKNTKEWNEWKNQGKRPENIPAVPYQIYKDKGWIGWADFLDTNNIYKGNWAPYTEAQDLARRLGLKSAKEWEKWRTSGKRPANIPSKPNEIYKDNGWTSWADFLGTNNFHKGDWLPFEEARDFVRSLGLKNQKEWQEYCKSGERPSNIPAAPYLTYKNDGWKGMNDLLGAKYHKWMPYEEAKEFARSLGLKTYIDWYDFCRTEKPEKIPACANLVYKDSGWTDWADFLGTENYRNIDWLPFEEARDFVRNIGLNSYKEWIEWKKSSEKPKNIPANPDQIYKGKGWIRWSDFLGNNNRKNIDWLPYKEARDFARRLDLNSYKEWNEISKSGKKPYGVPANPDKVYKGKGWTSWPDFLGKAA